MKTGSLKLVKDWLDQPRRRSTGGWSKVTNSDIIELQGVIDALIEDRFEPDPDGAPPIEFTLVNRNVSQRLHFFPVPYQHKDPDGHRSRAFANLRLAMGDADGAIRSEE